MNRVYGVVAGIDVHKRMLAVVVAVLGEQKIEYQQRKFGTSYGELEEDLLQPIREHEQSVTTSVGHTHPRTGRTILYVSQMNTREIVELSHDESEELLEALFNHLYDHAHVFEHEWRKGDLAAWDNLAIQHARSTVQKEGPVRTLRKVISPIPSMVGIETPKFSKVG